MHVCSTQYDEPGRGEAEPNVSPTHAPQREAESLNTHGDSLSVTHWSSIIATIAGNYPYSAGLCRGIVRVRGATSLGATKQSQTSRPSRKTDDRSSRAVVAGRASYISCMEALIIKWAQSLTVLGQGQSSGLMDGQNLLCIHSNVGKTKTILGQNTCKESNVC